MIYEWRSFLSLTCRSKKVFSLELFAAPKKKHLEGTQVQFVGVRGYLSFLRMKSLVEISYSSSYVRLSF